MVKVGDTVYVTKLELNIIDEPMNVVGINIPEITEYLGLDSAIVKNDQGETFATSRSEYKTEDEYFTKKTFDNIEEDKPHKFDVVTLKKKDKGTQRLFYQVVDTHRNGVSFIDDIGNKRTYKFDDVEAVSLNNWFDYFNDLQDQVYKMKQAFIETSNIIANDIKEGLKKLD